MTVGAYDIATEHAILAEASAAGSPQAIPAALLFGVFLGAVYDIFRMIASFLGLRGNREADDGCFHGILLCLRRYRCRPIRCRRDAVSDRPRRVPVQVLQCLLDILYFLVCGVLGAVFLYWRNDGILRWYLVLCGVLGFIAYSRSIGRWGLPVFLLLTAGLRAGLCAVFNAVLYHPVRLGYRMLTAIAAFTANTCSRGRQRIRQEQQKRRTRRILRVQKRAEEASPGTGRQKRSGLLWQRKKNSQRKKQAFSRRSRFSSSSASVPLPSFSSMDRLSNIKKK